MRDGHEVIGVDLRDAEVIADLSTAEGRGAMIDAVAAASKLALARWVRRTAVGPDWAGSRLRLNAVTPGSSTRP